MTKEKRNRPTTGDSPLKMGSLWIQAYRLNPSKPSSQESRGFNHGSVNRYARRASDKEIIALGPWIEQTSNAKGWCLKTPAPHPKTRGHGPIKGDGG